MTAIQNATHKPVGDNDRLPTLSIRHLKEKVVRILIVDDSKAMCAFLKNTIAADPGLEVVGCAHDAYEARALIKDLCPDIITLDIEMPKMDGITFLRNLMRLHPMPVIMLSSSTTSGSKIALEALSIGAVDYIPKQIIETKDQLENYKKTIISVTKSAIERCSPPSNQRPYRAIQTFDYTESCRARLCKSQCASDTLDKIICIGASSGGPDALKIILKSLFIPNTAVVITQHMPAHFLTAFAARINTYSRYEVLNTYPNAKLIPGHCYVANGESHTVLRKNQHGIFFELDYTNTTDGLRPSVDILFESAATTLGDAAIGILLSGMGKDGASGMKSMHNMGCLTIAQDEESSMVWGMPGSAVRLNAVDVVIPLDEIAPTLSALF